MAKILIIDDRAVNLEFLATLLTYSSHEVFQARDGGEALKIIETSKPDLIITDIIMPTMGGYELVQHLKTNPATFGIPVIFYTATYREEEARAVAERCGVQHVMMKPTEPEIILKTVNSILGEEPVREKIPVETQQAPDLGLLTDVLQDTLQETRRDAARLARITELSLELAGTIETQSLLENFSRGARDVIASQFSLVGVLSPADDSLQDYWMDGMARDSVAHLGAPQFKKAFVGEILRRGNPIRLSGDAALALPILFKNETLLTHSVLGVPLIRRNRVLGWICFAAKVGQNEFSHEDERLAVTLAAQFSVWYENTRLHAELERHARRLESEILERTHAEEELIKLSSAVEQSADTVVITDQDGIIEYVNPAFEKLTGYSKSDAIGKTPRILKSGVYDHRFYQSLWKTIKGGKTFRCQFTNRKKNGELLIEEQTITPIRNKQGLITHFVSTGKDITERQKSERALRESEQRFRQIAETISEVFWISDPGNTKMHYISPAYEKIWKRSCQSLYDHPLSFVEAIHPEDREGVLEEHRRTMTEGVFDKAYRIVRPDGEIRWIWAKGFPVYNSEGELFRIAGIAQDITEHRAAQEALQQSEEQFRMAFEEGPIGMALVGLDFKFLSVNRAYCELVGYTEEELKVMTFAELTHPEDQQSDVDQARRLLKGEIPNYQLQKRYLKKNGEEVWVQLTATVIRDAAGKVIYAFAMVENIHHKKRAEERLATQYAVTKVLSESATLKEAAPELLRVFCENLSWDSGEMWTVDEQSRLLQPIAAWQSPNLKGSDYILAGNQIEFRPGIGLPGMTWQQREAIWLEDLQTSSVFLRRKEASKSGLHAAFTFPINSKNETIAIVQLATTNTRSVDPILVEMFYSLAAQIGQFLERKQSEEVETQLRKQLLQSQKIEAIGQLAGGVAHDFNNILMAVMSYAELMTMQLPGDHASHKIALEIQKSAQQGANLTRQLLAFSRRQVLSPKVVDLNRSIGNMENMIRRLIGDDVELSISFADDLGFIKADPGQIEQIAINLAVNARDAMPEGGKLTIETSNINLDEEYSATHLDVVPGDYVLLAITDSGSGMSQQTLSHIFEPFFTTKEEGKGTGLGLSTVYGIVKQSGGHISVYSHPGQGTTFKIFFPRIDTEEEDARQKPAPTDVSGHGEIILLVDDNEGIRNAMATYLELKGYRILQASHGEIAIEVARTSSTPIDLLISDVVMPGMSGREIGRRLRSNFPEMKILYMSGYTQEAIKRHGILDQESGFFSKPISMPELLVKIREILETHTK